ncbi:MAG TPA: urate oxidase [Gemmatimonadaceae bacterium]|nr:urate oxidase [Gemmatimonadaceae bacterium]
MPGVLANDNYGKSAIRVVKVVREGARHTVHDLTVDVRCEGEFRAAHVDGDNAAVLPTDTMKNLVYALARQHDVHPLERFAALVGDRLLTESPRAMRVVVEIARHEWTRIDVEGRLHDTAFESGGTEMRIACAGSARGAPAATEAGVRDLVVLRTAGSAFSGFPRDAYTTLKETRDRIFCTSVSARWRYGEAPTDPDAAFGAVRQALLATFATHRSESVQHTLYAMGEAALGASDEADEIRLSLPNRHHLLVDLAAFGLDNPNEIFVPTREPYGLIEATVRRKG